MIKKIIFDLDNTLIMNSKNMADNYELIVQKYNMNTTKEELYDVIGMYETRTNKYKKEELLELINNYYKSNYSVEIVDDIIDCVSMWTYAASKELIDTLEYLSSKYELYVLSNFFLKSQETRLIGAGIYKYFKKVYSAEIWTKPDERAFTQFFDDCNPSDCVMIGDNYIMDIEVPNKLGMKTILCNFNNKDISYDGVVITKIEELINIL